MKKPDRERKHCRFSGGRKSFRAMWPLVPAFVFFLLFSLFAMALSPLAGERELYEGTVRFHILANSDSEKDQAVKLLVRDAVLKAVSDVTKDCRTKDEAEKAILQNKARILAVSDAVLSENGLPYTSSLLLGKEPYPQRSYGDVVFPAGTYTSLRLRLGKAEGHNWWCVLFPPLCTSVAVREECNEDEKANLRHLGFSESEVSLLTDEGGGKEIKKEIRFYLLDRLYEIKSGKSAGK